MAKGNKVKVQPNAMEDGDAQIFTYIGAGEGSPQVINFMGKQKFVRGQATEVTDEELLKKLPGCLTFVAGKVDPETIFSIDEDAKEKADKRRNADTLINKMFTKKHHGE